MRTIHIGWLAAGVAGAMLMACGGDDSNGNSPGQVEAGNDVETPLPDGSTPPVNEDATPGNDAKVTATDAGDAGPCNFATFVKGLVANDTTSSALPSADLGQSCTDDHDQAEFKSLFP